jgi:hypothetical protein
MVFQRHLYQTQEYVESLNLEAEVKIGGHLHGLRYRSASAHKV